MKRSLAARADIEDRLSGFFLSEATLPSDLMPAGDTLRAHDVLLTGATGLVGAYILRELVEQTDKVIFCIVRGDDEAAVRRRLADQLAGVGISASLLDSRVRALPGNVAVPKFGLSPGVFRDLADRVGIVFHNAARLNFLQSYRALRRVNVGGVHRVLEFAATGALKRIAYTSTAAVLESSARGPGVAAENAPLLFPEALAAGYAQTKWVAEAALNGARTRGFDVSIFRPPWILETGSLPAPDFVVRFMEGCRRIGALPDSTYRWNLVPADYVARSLVALALADGPHESVYHLGNAETLTNRELATRLERFGIEIPVIPIELWRKRLLASLDDPEENPLRPLVSLFFRSTAVNGTSVPADTYLFGRVPVMDSRHTIGTLAHLGVSEPTVDDTLLNALAWRR